MTARANWLLGMLLAALGVAHWSLGIDPSLPNREFLPDMARSVAADAYAASPVLPGGHTLQPPPPGTIARGLKPLGYAATEADAARAGIELVNPFAADDQAALARGRVVFGNTCAVCHGAGGLGNGPVTLRGVPPPPSFMADNAMNMADGRMFHVVTYGQKNMASYAAQVSREDRWKVILHIRSLQRQASAAPPAPPAPTAPPPPQTPQG
jgi:mono/diheme cytochrome c family protein